MKELPSHIVKVSDKWYKNEKTGKFIHSDKIEVWLETYWSFRSTATEISNSKRKYNANLKASKKRWGL